MTTTIHPAVAADRRTRREKKLDFWFGLAFQLLFVLLGGWMFMLAVGVVHHEWITWCPTIAFGPAVALAALLRAALAPIPNWRKS